jgi:C-terminal processing protease CtpA/Prc
MLAEQVSAGDAYREKVQIPAVSGVRCGRVSDRTGFPPGAVVGYIRISTFNKKTGDIFAQELLELKGNGVDAVVLDLRNNGGGFFPAGVQVCEGCLTRHMEACLEMSRATVLLFACRLRRAC